MSADFWGAVIAASNASRSSFFSSGVSFWISAFISAIDISVKLHKSKGRRNAQLWLTKRFRQQLLLGHRPLVEYAPGLGEADIALTEIANGKLTFESTFGQNGTAEAAARVVQFPSVTASKKAKKAA